MIRTLTNVWSNVFQSSKKELIENKKHNSDEIKLAPDGDGDGDVCHLVFSDATMEDTAKQEEDAFCSSDETVTDPKKSEVVYRNLCDKLYKTDHFSRRDFFENPENFMKQETNTKPMENTEELIKETVDLKLNEILDDSCSNKTKSGEGKKRDRSVKAEGKDETLNTVAVDKTVKKTKRRTRSGSAKSHVKEKDSKTKTIVATTSQPPSPQRSNSETASVSSSKGVTPKPRSSDSKLLKPEEKKQPKVGALKVIRKEIPCDLNQLYRKDMLAFSLNQMIRKFPLEYNFYPKTWIFPEQIDPILRYARYIPNIAFIVKPNVPGKIRLTRRIMEFKKRDPGVCQVFIDSPLSIHSHKFCFKFYCLIAWCKPFRVFVYNDGMTRFADDKFDSDTPISWVHQPSHITRTTKNKRGYMELDASRKISYTLKKLKFSQKQIRSLWDRVDDIAIKTIIAGHPLLKTNYEKFLVDTGIDYEVMSLDVMVNNDMKLFLIDVNQTPIVHPDFNLDKEVSKILYDMFVSLDLNRGDKTQKLKKVTLKMVESIRVEGGNNIKFNIQNDWENERVRNFRQIYPSKDSNKYDKLILFSKKLKPYDSSEPVIVKESVRKMKTKRESGKRKKKMVKRKRKKSSSSSSSSESDSSSSSSSSSSSTSSSSSSQESSDESSKRKKRRVRKRRVKKVNSESHACGCGNVLSPVRSEMSRRSKKTSPFNIPLTVSQASSSTKTPAVISRSNFTSFSDLQSRSFTQRNKKRRNDSA